MFFLTTSLVAWATLDDWPQVSSPSASNVDRNPINGVSFTASDNGHAVGYTFERPSGLAQGQALRWKGTSWEQASVSDLSVDNKLYGVATVSDTDAWAVGSYDNAQGYPLIMRYNGTSWSQYSVTISGSSASVLMGVTVNSSSDVWAVGFYAPSGGGNTKTLTMHWNGTNWTAVNSPNQGTGINKLYGVSTVPGSSHLFWAVGA
jgi:hypothetical protein